MPTITQQANLLNKYKDINGLGYYTYTRLFQSGVCPILDYRSKIWGFRYFYKVDSIQNKAIRIYVGVHRFTPIAAINGDMGWTHSSVRRKVCMLRFWKRIINLFFFSFFFFLYKSRLITINIFQFATYKHMIVAFYTLINILQLFV